MKYQMPEKFAHYVAELMAEHGPDGHIDGWEIISKLTWEWLEEKGYISE